jgi:hypothetical protein
MARMEIREFRAQYPIGRRAVYVAIISCWVLFTAATLHASGNRVSNGHDAAKQVVVVTTPQAVLVARYFKLPQPELLGAIVEYERRWGTPIVDKAQNYCAKLRTPGSNETIGPLQLSCGTIRSIEKNFLSDPTIPSALKRKLLPKIENDRDCADRALSEEWSYTYAAAWVYMYEKQHRPSIDFINWWNGNPGGKLAPLAKRYYRQNWYQVAPGLLSKYKQICANS